MSCFRVFDPGAPNEEQGLSPKVVEVLWSNWSNEKFHQWNFARNWEFQSVSAIFASGKFCTTKRKDFDQEFEL